MRTILYFLSRGAALRALLGAVLAALAAARLAAQECQPFRPAPEHRLLAASAGDFDLAFSDGNKGSSSCALGLGGQWLLENVKADFHGHSYEGRGATSYDPARRKYVCVWIDSASPTPLVAEGAYDPATKTLTLSGDMTAPDGTTAKATLVTVHGDKGRRTFAMKVSDVELFRITYTRAK